MRVLSGPSAIGAHRQNFWMSTGPQDGHEQQEAEEIGDFAGGGG